LLEKAEIINHNNGRKLNTIAIADKLWNSI